MSIFRHLISIVLAMLVTASVPAAGQACVESTAGTLSMQRGWIRLANDVGEVMPLEVLIADDAFERASGFQHICPEVIGRTLILFLYSREVRASFHMQNVHSPLDIAFFDSAGRVVGVRLMKTYTEDSRPLYGPGGPFRFALEAPAGFFAERGISTGGSRLILQ